MIDEAYLRYCIRKCKHLKYKFVGVYAADNFPVTFEPDTFMIVNSDKSKDEGSHWVVVARRGNDYVFGAPLGLPIYRYKNISDRLAYADFGLTEIIDTPIQTLASTLCGFYCIYIAHYLFSSYYPVIPFIHEEQLLRFVHHLL